MTHDDPYIIIYSPWSLRTSKQLVPHNFTSLPHIHFHYLQQNTAKQPQQNFTFQATWEPCTKFLHNLWECKHIYCAYLKMAGPMHNLGLMEDMQADTRQGLLFWHPILPLEVEKNTSIGLIRRYCAFNGYSTDVPGSRDICELGIICWNFLERKENLNSG